MQYLEMRSWSLLWVKLQHMTWWRGNIKAIHRSENKECKRLYRFKLFSHYQEFNSGGETWNLWSELTDSNVKIPRWVPICRSVATSLSSLISASVFSFILLPSTFLYFLPLFHTSPLPLPFFSSSSLFRVLYGFLLIDSPSAGTTTPPSVNHYLDNSICAHSHWSLTHSHSVNQCVLVLVVLWSDAITLLSLHLPFNVVWMFKDFFFLLFHGLKDSL